MNGFSPTTGSTADWNAAYYRLEDYLRAHSVVNKVYQSQIILRLLQRASERHQLNPSENPTRLVLEEAYREIDEWFERVLPGETVPSARRSNLGRVSMRILDATERWPNVFLAQGDLPEDFIDAMRRTSLQSGPDLRISTMVPRAGEIHPLTGILEEALQKVAEILFAGIILLPALGHGSILP